MRELPAGSNPHPSISSPKCCSCLGVDPRHDRHRGIPATNPQLPKEFGVFKRSALKSSPPFFHRRRRHDLHRADASAAHPFKLFCLRTISGSSDSRFAFLNHPAVNHGSSAPLLASHSLFMAAARRAPQIHPQHPFRALCQMQPTSRPIKIQWKDSLESDSTNTKTNPNNENRNCIRNPRRNGSS